MMRRFIVGCGLALALAAGLFPAGAAAPTSFAGTWALDKAKSKDLPPQMENVESYTLTVTQDAQQLTADTKIKRNEAAGGEGGGPPGGGPGGGGMRRGGGMMGPANVTYKLDGSETTLDTGGRGTAAAKAEWQNGGKTLKLTTKRTFNFQGEERTLTTTEVWDLSADGKTLTIQRSSETPQGARNSTLVFNKQ
ncbi:MAG TPA: hypothetical protein VF546_13310 [Pyrinomonadaceae bacterium]|jgi:hypothetical protein